MRTHGIKTRRDFLRFGARTLSAVGAASAFGPAGLLCERAAAQTASDYKALVCVFLFGGNDANNVLIPNGKAAPYLYSDYQKVRQNLAIAQNTLVSINDPVTKETFGLHPSLAPLGPLYAPPTGAPRLALLANVGTLVRPMSRKADGSLDLSVVPSNLYSHSDQQQEWQNAIAAPNNSNRSFASSGWAGRLIDKYFSLANSAPGFPPGIGINGGALQLVGVTNQPTALGGDGFSVANQSESAAAGLQQMLKLPSGVTLIQSLQGSIKSAIDVSNTVNSLLGGAGAIQAQFPDTGLGQALAQVASVISVAPAGLGATRQIFFCSQGGYDTHSQQAGQHAQLLAELGGAMAAFNAYLQNAGLGNKVVTFTESDFSRTFQPNGNAGTDHAWGSHALIMGPVKSAQIFGKFPVLALKGPDDASNDRGNWAPTTSSDQYEAELAKWFGVTKSSDLDAVFPNLNAFGYQTPSILV